MVNQNLRNVIDEQKKSLANSRDMAIQGRGHQVPFAKQRRSLKGSGQFPDHKIGTIIEDPARDSLAMNQNTYSRALNHGYTPKNQMGLVRSVKESNRSSSTYQPG